MEVILEPPVSVPQVPTMLLGHLLDTALPDQVCPPWLTLRLDGDSAQSPGAESP